MAGEALVETSMGTIDVADNGEALSGKTQPREFIKGKRRAEQEAQVNAGKQKGQLPKKRFYRARAHSNPLSDCQFSVYVSFPLPPDFTQKEMCNEFTKSSLSSEDNWTKSYIKQTSGTAILTVNYYAVSLIIDRS